MYLTLTKCFKNLTLFFLINHEIKFNHAIEFNCVGVNVLYTYLYYKNIVIL